MDIILKTEKIIESNLSINDYLYLNYLYLKSKNEDAKDLLDIISSFDDDHLQSRGYLKITESGNVLRSKAIELFESKELFYKFLSIFPIKTPSGRYLSPAGTEGIAVQNLKKKLIKLFKNKPVYEEKAILVLEAEIEWRRKTGNMEYIHAAEAWLNGGDYEKFEYLLDAKKEDESRYEKDSL